MDLDMETLSALLAFYMWNLTDDSQSPHAPRVCVSLSLIWANCWTNGRHAYDLRRRDATALLYEHAHRPSDWIVFRGPSHCFDVMLLCFKNKCRKQDSKMRNRVDFEITKGNHTSPLYANHGTSFAFEYFVNYDHEISRVSHCMVPLLLIRIFQSQYR